MIYLCTQHKQHNSFLHNMKKLIYILLILPLIVVSCVDNKDEPTPPNISELVDIPLSIESMEGTWETYYTEKHVNDNKSSYRTIDYDGFLTTYYKDGRFEDRNPFGDLIFKGTFRILRNDTIEYSFKNKNNVDTVTKKNFSALKGTITGGVTKTKFLSTYVSAKGTVDKTTYIVTDTRIMRNISNAAGEHPNINKQSIDYSKLVGTWQFYNYSYYSNGVLDRAVSAAMTKKYKDNQETKYIFLPNNRIAVYANNIIVAEGSIKIVDDVIYIKDDIKGTKSILKALKNNVDTTTSDQSLPDSQQNPNEDDSFYIWLKNWKSATDATTFIDFDEFRNAHNITEIIKKEIIFLKQQ